MQTKIERLTREFASDHADGILTLIHGIPHMSGYDSPEDLLDEHIQTDGKFLNTKWLYSLVAVDHRHEPVGIAIAFERGPDGTENYPEASIHLHALAVAPGHQRNKIGSRLLQSLIIGASTVNHGYYMQPEITGEPFQFSLTTSGEPSNEDVRQFYQDFGFTAATHRQIGSRSYVTMRRPQHTNGAL